MNNKVEQISNKMDNKVEQISNKMVQLINNQELTNNKLE